MSDQNKIIQAKQKARDQFLRKRGIVLGALVPVLASPVIAFILFSIRTSTGKASNSAMGFWDYYFALIDHRTESITMISLCALCNLPVFFYLTWKKKDSMAKGMILSTLAWALLYFTMYFT